MKFTATVKSAIAAAGKSGVNAARKSNCANWMSEAFSRTIEPQSAVGGWMPTPRNYRAAIVRNTKENRSPNSATMGGRMLGLSLIHISEPTRPY